MTAKTADQNECGCGCGEMTGARFRPGHDARHAGAVGRALAADGKDKSAIAALDRMTPALRAKAERIRHNATAKPRDSK